MRAIDRRSGRTEVAWVSPKILPVPKMGAQFSKYIWGRPDPETGRFVSHIDKYAQVEPIPGFAGCDALLHHWILETIVFFKPSFRYGLYYRTFRERLERLGYRVGQDLMVYTYDWRQSMCDPGLLEDMHALITLMRERNGGRKVNVVAHSLGGMLVQSYMRHYPDWSDDVRRFVGLGIPYDGASANALSAYYNGFALDLPLIRRVVAKGLQATSTNTMYLCNAPRQLSRITSCVFYKRWINSQNSVDRGGAGSGGRVGCTRAAKAGEAAGTVDSAMSASSLACKEGFASDASVVSAGSAAFADARQRFSLASTLGPTPDPTQPSTKSGDESPSDRSRRYSDGSTSSEPQPARAAMGMARSASAKGSESPLALPAPVIPAVEVNSPNPPDSLDPSDSPCPQARPLSRYSRVDDSPSDDHTADLVVEECTPEPETLLHGGEGLVPGPTSATVPPPPITPSALAPPPSLPLPVLQVDCSRYRRSCPSLPAVLVEKINSTPGLIAPEHLRDAFKRLLPGIKSSAISKRSKDLRKRNIGSRDMDLLMHPDVKAHLPTVEELRSEAQGPRARDAEVSPTHTVSKARLRRQAARVRRNERRLTRQERDERRREGRGLNRSEREARDSARALAGMGAPLESHSGGAQPLIQPAHRRKAPATNPLGFWRWEAVSMWPQTSFKGFVVPKELSRRFTETFSHPWFDLVNGRPVLREDCPRRELVLKKQFPDSCSYWDYPDMVLIAEAIEILWQQGVEEIPKRLAAAPTRPGKKRPKLVKPPAGLAEELAAEPRPWNCISQAKTVSERSVYATLESAYPKRSLEALLFEPYLPYWAETLDERSRPIYPPKEGSGFKYLGIIGSGKRTPIHVVYQKPVSTVHELIDQEPTSIWGDGDGTVLTNSAMGDGFADEFVLDRVVVNGPIHYFLVHDDAVWKHIWRALQ